MELYMSSYEYADFEETRRLVEYDVSEIDNRVAMRVRVDKPVIGQKYGYGGQDISILYLVARFQGSTLGNLTDFPIHVYVLLPEPDQAHISKLTDLKNIAWAVLYDNFEDARDHKL